MRKILSLTVILCCVTFGLSAQDFKIVGYMPSWSGSASNIQYSKLTHINYSFVEPNSNGSGALNAVPNTSKLTSIVSLAHAANVKVFIAVGGFGDGNDSEWASIAASSTKINLFRDNLMAIVWQYDLDGVDIDWEFPSNDAEAEGFVNLMTVLADTLHKSNMELTAAVIAQGSTANYIYDEIFDLVDWINIMAYDASSGGSHHASYNYATGSLDYWINRGLAPSKAILGVPFYGRGSGNIYQSYSSIVANNTANAQADYYDNASFVRIFYTGIPNMKLKTTYAKNNGGGIMIWELSQDASGAYAEYSLLTAINEVQPAIQTPVKNAVTFNASLYPNPVRDRVYIEAADATVNSFQYEVVDLSGKLLLNGVINGRSGEIPVSTLPQGMYIMHLKEGDKVSAVRLVKE